MNRKFAGVLRKLQDAPGLSEDEKILGALSLSATPDERWRMLINHLRSLGLSRLSEQKKRGLFSLE